MPWTPNEPLFALADRFNRHADEQQRVLVASARDVSGTSHVRFLASPACDFVQVHVQHTGTGGGGSTYNPSTYASSTEVDCRSDRQQDTTVARTANGAYTLWLIPVQKINGTAVKYDGEDGRPDQMTVVSLGASVPVYQEGTWTPTLVGGTSAGSYSVAVTSSTAKYVKIGRAVMVSGYFTVTVNSAGSGNAVFGGLPFPKAAGELLQGTVRLDGTDLSAGALYVVVAGTSAGAGSTVVLAEIKDDATASILPVTAISTGDGFGFSFTYFAS